MVTGHYTLEQAEAALKRAGDPTAIKVIVRPGQ